MGRSFQIFGEAMVRVAFGAHVKPIASGAFINVFDLGLLSEPARIHLNFRHQDIKTDSFGPDIPIDQQFMLADATIQTRLVHYDNDVLEICMREATGGGGDPTSATQPAGTLAVAGTIMGGGATAPSANQPSLPASGEHYIELSIIPGNSRSKPWRFPTAYLSQQPVIMPLGTEHSIVECVWRAIPYSIQKDHEITISGILKSGPLTGGFGSLRITPLVESSIPDSPSAAPLLWDHALENG